ncbi:hypothetical protein BN946_scf184980.g31 [Trametes cinnabarina]|uniref:ubiquitinyl hydrolase 1 n=1 Tax=Pycnoporus cinnabarinus TaxID=5643 RepID=A0A060SDN9_PYCCI|nr:hypothetical protein BN946_scf184980.g31 [Trametes cinnabarina]
MISIYTTITDCPRGLQHPNGVHPQPISALVHAPPLRTRLARPRARSGPGDGHWFNLNSFLNRPERIGKLYLGMFLQQAEAEGYSVFAVVQRDPEAPLAIPRTDADQLAASIPESAAGDFSSRASGSASASRSAHPFQGVEGLEDEDFELQAALQASLSGGNFDPSAFAAASSHGTPPPLYTARSSTTTYQQGGGASSTSAVRREYEVIEDDDDDDEIVELPGPPPRATEPADPVAASMARQRAVMERMARMQEVALQQQYQEEVAGFDAMARRRQRAPPEGQDDEDELFRRALAESEALAQQHAARQVEEAESASAAPPPPAWHQHRVYDDEDQELQAALRASLETVPEGFRVTTPPPILEASSSAAVERPSAAATLQPPQPPMQRQASSDVETESEAEVPEPEEQLSMEEIRRRRLAKFGG